MRQSAILIKHVGVGVVVLMGLLAGRMAHAQELIWVTVEGRAPVISGDKQKARHQAILNAERQAVADALIKRISIETLMINLRLSGSIAGAIPYGRVAQKKILEEELVKVAGNEPDKQDRLFRVRMKAGVVREINGEDPPFNLDASVNQFVFKDGDELEIHIRSSRDCYFAIFNILENQSVIRLLPNYLSLKDFLDANENFVFPSKKDRENGLRLVLHLPKNKTTTTESIYILALTRPFGMKSINVQEGIFGIVEEKASFLKDLVREVVCIPLTCRSEALMQYEIRKNK